MTKISTWPSGTAVKNPSANPGDTDSIPGSGGSPRGGHGNPLHYSCLGNPMDRGACWATVHRVAKSQKGLKQLSIHARWSSSGCCIKTSGKRKAVQVSGSTAQRTPSAAAQEGERCAKRAQSLSPVRPFVTPWTVAHQAPLSMGILQARILQWVAMPSSRGSSQPRDRTHVSHVAGEFFTS